MGWLSYLIVFLYAFWKYYLIEISFPSSVLNFSLIGFVAKVTSTTTY
jgi:hypothetical protein